MIRSLSRKKVGRVQFKPTWDHFIASRRANLNAVHIDHDLADCAFARLQQFFGDDPVAMPDRVMDYVINCAPHTYEWISWFAGCLDKFSTAVGYDLLCADLRDAEKNDSALTVLQVADRMQAIGLEVGFDPSVRVDGKTKVPDLALRDGTVGLSFYGEVSIMFNADSHVEASNVFDRVFQLIQSFRDDPVAYNGHILREIAPEEVEGLMGRVWLEILEVQRDRALREVRLNDQLLLALAPVALKSEVDRWAEAHRLEPGSFGTIMPPVNELMRFYWKVGEKARQLPAGRPNVVAIWAANLLLVSPDPRVLLPHIRAIARVHPKVALLVVVFENTSLPIADAVVDDCLIVASKRGGVGFHFVVVPNDACPTPFPPDFLQRLKGAFAL